MKSFFELYEQWYTETNRTIAKLGFFKNFFLSLSILLAIASLALALWK